MMEVEVVAGIGVEIRCELGVLEDGAGGLLEYTFTFSVADDVVILSRNCLKHYS